MPHPGGITGNVTTVSGNLITLLNGALTVDVTGATIHNRRGSATIADVKPGSQVFITLRNPNAAPGTMLQGATVMILDPPAGSMTGPVQSVDVAGSSLTILGVRVLVTPATKITGLTRSQTTLAQIKPGDLAVVEVNITGSALVAESILLFPPVPNVAPPQDWVVQGTVKSISATSWVITREGRDVTVVVDGHTKIDSSLKVGDSAIVIGRPDLSGNVIAISIMRSDSKRRSSRS